TRHRNIAVSPASPSVGATLLEGALASAAQSTGFSGVDDAVVLDGDAPLLAGARAEDVADRWIFSGNRPAVREVRVGGKRVVADGVHPEREAIAQRYAAVVRDRLLG